MFTYRCLDLCAVFSRKQFSLLIAMEVWFRGMVTRVGGGNSSGLVQALLYHQYIVVAVVLHP